MNVAAATEPSTLLITVEFYQFRGLSITPTGIKYISRITTPYTAAAAAAYRGPIHYNCHGSLNCLRCFWLRHVPAFNQPNDRPRSNWTLGGLLLPSQLQQQQPRPAQQKNDGARPLRTLDLSACSARSLARPAINTTTALRNWLQGRLTQQSISEFTLYKYSMWKYFLFPYSYLFGLK